MEKKSVLMWLYEDEKPLLNEKRKATGKTWREYILGLADIPCVPIPLGRPTKN